MIGRLPTSVITCFKAGPDSEDMFIYDNFLIHFQNQGQLVQLFGICMTLLFTFNIQVFSSWNSLSRTLYFSPETWFQKVPLSEACDA